MLRLSSILGFILAFHKYWDDVLGYVLGRRIELEKGRESISIEAIGKYKRKCWEFQKECRYKIFGSPMGIKEINAEGDGTQAILKQREMIRRILDKDYNAPYEALYVNLSQKALEEMEIILGPRITDSEEKLLRAFLEKYGLGKNLRRSELRIR